MVRIKLNRKCLIKVNEYLQYIKNTRGITYRLRTCISLTKTVV